MTIDWDSTRSLGEAWRTQGLAYAEAINSYVAKGLADGWDRAGEQPVDPRGPLAEAVLEVVRAASRAGEVETLRELFPPALEPFADSRDGRAQSIGPVLLLEDGRLVFRVGATHERNRVIVANGSDLRTLEDVLCVGRSPDRRYIAVARPRGVEIRDGWDGPLCRKLRWPTHRERALSRARRKPHDGPPPITAIIPFPDGERALLMSPEGVFVLDPTAVTLVHPREEDSESYLDWHSKQFPDEEPVQTIAMEHGAISPDGRYIAVGEQDGNHRVLDAKSLAEIASIAPRSAYPHHAVFSADGGQLALNSCHFYNGETIAVATALLPGLVTKPGKRDRRLLTLDRECRVYASAVRRDEYIFGDAYGYLRAFSVGAEPRWRHHVGATISGMDISEDGGRLVVATHGGTVHLLELDTGTRDPYAIGTATHRERFRWLFWRGEQAPLLW